MKKRVLSLALCLVLVVGLFSGLTVNASASKIDDLKKEVAERLIKEKIEQFKEEFEIPDLDTDAILNSFATAATEGDFGENNCLHWEVSTGVLSGKTLTISGTGAMPDFDFPNGNLAPWWNYEALGMLTSFGNFKLEGELKKVVIKDGVTNVSNYALFLLPAATQITLPDSVTSIGRYGIAMCSKLTGMSIPKAVTEIGDFCLAGDGLTAVTLPDGLQSLGRGAFDTCTSLTNTTLPAAITAVPGKCFADCTKLLNVKYAGTVTAIGDLAFESCKALTAAPIPETVTEIGASAFTGCTALTDVTIPAGVTAIPDGCFQGCTALKDMKLPGTVTSVGHNAFTGCTALGDVRCYGAAPTVEPGNSEAHSFEPAIVTIHYNPDPVYGWTLDADGKWQGYTVSSKGACLHTGYGTTENTVPATCGEAGRVDTICSNCGEVISTKEIPATGEHTWDNGTVTTERAHVHLRRLRRDQDGSHPRNGHARLSVHQDRGTHLHGGRLRPLYLQRLRRDRKAQQQARARPQVGQRQGDHRADRDRPRRAHLYLHRLRRGQDRGHPRHGRTHAQVGRGQSDHGADRHHPRRAHLHLHHLRPDEGRGHPAHRRQHRLPRRPELPELRLP